MSRLDVVIVSYRCRELLRNCLTSLPGALRGPMRMIVVDNASEDGTVEMVSSEFPEVELIAAERNLGFAAATNVGIQRSGAEYVLALNPDTRLTAGALDRLIEAMDARPEVGVCGPRLVREDGSLDHAAKRSFPTPLGALAHFAGMSRSQYRAPDVEEGPVDAVNGAFMIMRRRMLDEIGLFDEGYWMYMEDLDLCYRAKEARWLTWYEASVTALHAKGGGAARRTSPKLVWHFHYGMHRFYRKHYARDRSLFVNAVVYLGIGAKLVFGLARAVLRRPLRGRRPRGSTVATAAR